MTKDVSAVPAAVLSPADNISDLQLPPGTKLYFYKSYAAPTIDQHSCIFVLMDVVDQVSYNLERLKEKEVRLRRTDLSYFFVEGALTLTGLRFLIAENGLEIKNYQLSILREFINIAQEKLRCFLFWENLLR